MKFKISYLFYIILLVSSSNFAQIKDIVPTHDEFAIESKEVGETRNINVWTPPEYNSSTQTLPVMYMADGGIIDEDFPHIANTLAELIKAKQIPPMILVGIANTQRRRDLTGPTEVKKDKKIAPIVGESSKFRAFIKNELFLEISKRYRTNNQKSIIGESLSGLFVLETFFLAPEMFNNYIAFDPSLWWNDHFLLKNAKDLLVKFPKDQTKLWFAGSSTKEIEQYTKNLAELLATENNNYLKWTYSPEPKEDHNTIFRATKVKALLWTFGRQDK